MKTTKYTLLVIIFIMIICLTLVTIVGHATENPTITSKKALYGQVGEGAFDLSAQSPWHKGTYPKKKKKLKRKTQKRKRKGQPLNHKSFEHKHKKKRIKKRKLYFYG